MFGNKCCHCNEGLLYVKVMAWEVAYDLRLFSVLAIHAMNKNTKPREITLSKIDEI